MNTLIYALRHQRRGSAILAVVLFAIFALTILFSLLPSLVSEYRLNIRNRLHTVAVGISEYGTKQAVWALNQYGTDDTAWETAGWKNATESDGDPVRLREYTIGAGGGSTYTLDGGETARVRVVVRDIKPFSCEVVSDATVYRGDMEVSQMVILTVSNTAPFMGLIAKDGITFSGQPAFDSFNSTVFPFYYASGVNSGNNVTVGSVSTLAGSVDLGNGHIYGNVVSGASDPLVSGAVTGGKTITGTVVGDFYMDFPDVTAPDTTGWATSF